MQQPSHPMSQISPGNITTEQIQKYLDENKQLILAILDNQNLGKLAECAQYQAQLQKNLLYLAAIADAQPPTPSVRPQVVPHPAMQQGGPFIQQGGPAFPPRPLMQYAPQQIHGQPRNLPPPSMPFPSHLGLRSGVINGMQSIHLPLNSHGASGGELPPSSTMTELPRGSAPVSSSMDGQSSRLDAGKADISTGGSTDGQRSSGSEHVGGEVVEPPTAYLKRNEDSKT
ncbi:GRF1-interacting factor 2-like [Phalaenopsis equestris]|uniref:GRF1-interacting factor 2-like n=1 Tax=Phalaenopsis equestris TaxID=78828 RepID=UPI0009E2051A|nr:GRF1-interacting factor 2-like [Phalaenopsis equestris]